MLNKNNNEQKDIRNDFLLELLYKLQNYYVENKKIVNRISISITCFLSILLLFLYINTNRNFEAMDKLYHFVLAVDTSQSTDANRIKFYVDVDQITSFSTEVYPSQDYQGHVGNNQEHTWGAASGNQEPYDGYMGEINYVDGTAYGPDTFGLTDTSTGRWIPKTLGSFNIS